MTSPSDNLPPGVTQPQCEGATECPHQYANGVDAIETIYGGGFYCPICQETFEELPDEVAPLAIRDTRGNGLGGFYDEKS